MIDTPLDSLSLEQFTSQVNTRFILRREDDEGIELVLVEAAPSRSMAAARAAGVPLRQEMFHLHFRGPSAPVLPQSLYRLEHENLGRFAIFLVPIGHGPEGVVYEAVFNRLTQ